MGLLAKKGASGVAAAQVQETHSKHKSSLQNMIPPFALI
jgi:hypothetical protein